MGEKTKRFLFALTEDEYTALKNIAREDRCSNAAVLRRLVWIEAKGRNLIPAGPDQGVNNEK